VDDASTAECTLSGVPKFSHEVPPLVDVKIPEMNDAAAIRCPSDVIVSEVQFPETPLEFQDCERQKLIAANSTQTIANTNVKTRVFINPTVNQHFIKNGATRQLGD
jgi:hypothetical protein